MTMDTMRTDALAEFRRKTEGQTITRPWPGEIVFDVDGSPAGMTPNITSTEIDGIACAWVDE
jgi:hypothetical protein